MKVKHLSLACALASLLAPLSAHAWTAMYNSGGGTNDYAVDVAVDASGNVYVTGYSFSASYDIVTLKYNAGGTLSSTWPDVGFGVGVRRWSGPAGADDRPVAIGLDPAGNVFVSGRSVSAGGNSDVIVLKYDPGGNPSAAWPNQGDGVGVRRWSVTPGSTDDATRAMVVGINGRAYLSALGAGDYETLVYEPNGTLAWVRRYNGPASGVDTPADIALDGSGNVYVTGASPGVGTGSDYATIAYNSAGNTIWSGGSFHNGAARYNGPANGSDGGRALVVTSSALYVTGGSDGVGTGADYATLRYTLAGATTWPNAGGIFHNGAARYNGPTNGSDNAAAIATDGVGVVVTGSSWGTGQEIATVRYTATGATPWPAAGAGFHNGAARYTSPGMPQTAWSVGVAVDTVGDVYVTGTSMIMPMQFNYVTFRYAGGNGATLWTSVYDGPTGTNDDNAAALVRAGGYVYVTGSSIGVGTGRDFGTVRYNATNGVP